MATKSDSEYEKWVKIKTKKEEIAKENNEKIVADRIAKRANSEGWDSEEHTGHEHGIDLRLERGNHIIIIEAKGERPNLSQRGGRSRVVSALGQIILHMKDGDADNVYCYCLAFPATPAFTECKIPCKPRKLLRLNIIYVDCYTGLCKVLLPSGKNAINFGSFDELFHAD